MAQQTTPAAGSSTTTKTARLNTAGYSTTPPAAGPADTVAKAVYHPKDGCATFLEHCDQFGRVTTKALLDKSKNNEIDVTVYHKAPPHITVFTDSGGFSLCQQFTPEAARILACALNLAADHVDDLMAVQEAFAKSNATETAVTQ